MQTVVNESPSVAIAGMLADAGPHEVVSPVCATLQLEQVVVTTEDNSQDFTVTINGSDYTYTSDASATKAEISAGLKAAIDAGGESVQVTDDLTDTLLIESTDHDAGFTIAVAAGGSGVLTLTSLVSQEQTIEFGKVVVRDEQLGNGFCRLPRQATDITGNHAYGIAKSDTSRVTRTTAPYGGYNAGDAISVVRKGRIWVEVEDYASVVDGGAVYVRFAASGTEELGSIRTDADTADAAILPGAKFYGVAVGTMAVVELNIP